MLRSRARARALVVVAALLVGLAAAPVAPAQDTTTETETTTTEETTTEETAPDYVALRGEIRSLRHRINWVRVNRCYPRRTWRRAVSAIPDEEVEAALAWTETLLKRARDLPRRCPSSYSWNLGPRRAHHVWRWRQSSQSRCILKHETGWPPWYGAHTGNGFHGAWQANVDFARSYALRTVKRRWGTDAHPYPRWAQDAMAHRGYHARNGWRPWPLSASKCGLPWYPDLLR